MRILDDIDNSVVVVFLMIFAVALYILWNVMQFILSKKPNRRSNLLGEEENNDQMRADPYYNVAEHEECSICTERMKYKVELDCRHCYCGKCIMDYYDRVRPNNLKCPLCRREIRLINDSNVMKNQQTQEFYDKITNYNHKNINGLNYVIIFLIF